MPSNVTYKKHIKEPFLSKLGTLLRGEKIIVHSLFTREIMLQFVTKE